MDVMVFLLLLLAVVLGWSIGRFTFDKLGADAKNLEQAIPESYYQGLNYLINNKPDEEIDTFIHELDVNQNTLEMHVALGNLLRRRGEVDRAIRIHQNLVARPSLTPAQQNTAHLELARDYMKAGLLDRAEGLLIELNEQSAEHRLIGLGLLVEIYQEEREWLRAIETAQRMLPQSRWGSKSSDPKLIDKLANYCCELSLQMQQAGKIDEARDWIDKASSYDKRHLRVVFLQADDAARKGQFGKVIELLENLPAQQTSLVVTRLDLLVQAYYEKGDFHGLIESLSKLQKNAPSVPVMLKIAELIETVECPDSAIQFLQKGLVELPSIEGVDKLLTLMHSQGSGLNSQEVSELTSLMHQLAMRKTSFLCHSCGFQSKQLFWNCPTCKSWSSMNYKQGFETH